MRLCTFYVAHGDSPAGSRPPCAELLATGPQYWAAIQGRIITVPSDKPDLRRHMRAVRAAMPAAERRAGDLALISGALPVWEGAVVSGYLAIGDEIDPAPLLDQLHQRGHALCIPVMSGRDMPLTFRAYVPGDTLATVQWGIREPTADKPVVEPHILLVPLLAVDRAGFRLGYGGGYYDRTLKQLRMRKTVLAIGLAFDAQVIDAVPHLDYDQRIDAVLTPSGYRAFPY